MIKKIMCFTFLSMSMLTVPMSLKPADALINVVAQESLPVSRSIFPAGVNVNIGADKDASYGYDHASVKQISHSPQSEYTMLQRAGDKATLEKLQADLKKDLDGWLFQFQRKAKEQQKAEIDKILADPLTDALATIKTADVQAAINTFDRFSNGILWPEVQGGSRAQKRMGGIQTSFPSHEKRAYTDHEYTVAENLLKSRDDYKAYVAQQEKQLAKQREAQQKQQAQQKEVQQKTQQAQQKSTQHKTTQTPDLDTDMVSTPAYNRTSNISPEVDQRIAEALSKIDKEAIDDLPQFLDAVGQVLDDLEQQGLLTPEEQINALGIMVGTYLQDMADTGKWKDSFVEFVEQQGQSMREAANAAYKDFCEKNPELNLPEHLDYANIEELDQIISSTMDGDSNLSPEEKVYVDRARYAAQLTRTSVIYGAFLYAAGQMGGWESSGPACTSNNLDNTIKGAPVMVTTDGVAVQPVAAETEMGYIAAAASYLQNFFGPDNGQNQDADQLSGKGERYK